MKHPFLAIVHDEPSIRESVTHALASGGYASQEFENGREFLDGHHPATAGVILGVMGGRETLDEMRRRGMTIPVIMMSGYVSRDESPEMIRIGDNAFFAKAFGAKDILEAVAGVMG